MIDKIGLDKDRLSSETKSSFDWLNKVEEEEGNRSSEEPLCQVKALCTTTMLDEFTVTLRGEKIVGVLCTAVAVDENRLKSKLKPQRLVPSS